MANNFQISFPFLPAYSSWENFNGNLIMYYGQEHIPYTPEENWQHTAKNIAQSSSFSVFPVPDPEKFTSWQDWAGEFVLIVNAKPKN